MSLSQEIQRLKSNEPITIKKGKIQIPLAEIPIGTNIKIGVLTEGKWENTILPLTEELIKVITEAKLKGDIFSLELK